MEKQYTTIDFDANKIATQMKERFKEIDFLKNKLGNKKDFSTLCASLAVIYTQYNLKQREQILIELENL